jgi:hypothetical protein
MYQLSGNVSEGHRFGSDKEAKCSGFNSQGVFCRKDSLVSVSMPHHPWGLFLKTSAPPRIIPELVSSEKLHIFRAQSESSMVTFCILL